MKTTCDWCPETLRDVHTGNITRAGQPATSVLLSGCLNCDTLREDYLCQRHGTIAASHVTRCSECRWGQLETLWETL